MNLIHYTKACVIAAVVSSAGMCFGATIIPPNVDDWSVNETWTAVNALGGAANASMTQPASVGGQTGLRLDISTGGNFVPLEDRVSHTSTFNGNYASFGPGSVVVQSIRFDFYTDSGSMNNLPGSLELFFVGGGNIWRYNLMSALNEAVGWNAIAINTFASNPNLWFSNTGTTLATDLETVSEIGLMIGYQPDTINQIYGIDNFRLDNEIMVPEPEEYAMLAMLGIALAYAFRDRLNQQLKSALALAKR